MVRIVIGVTIFLHGYNHVWGGGKIGGTARWFASLGMKPGIVHAWLASVTELVCGPLLILGLLNPLAAAGVVGVMAVAFVTNHRPNGFFIFRPGEGYEYVLNLGVAALALGALGPGEWSLDKALYSGTIAQVQLFGITGLFITAVAGLGGAAVLLLGFWRPAPKEPAAESEPAGA
ncbi:MAG: DoxX family protein [Actinobacteria bacterium]|nr:DoxX family protein [Actinomycetota bacterium]